jgi:hypothetical protein
MKIFRDKNVLTKGQGARVKFEEKIMVEAT